MSACVLLKFVCLFLKFVYNKIFNCITNSVEVIFLLEKRIFIFQVERCNKPVKKCKNCYPIHKSSIGDIILLNKVQQPFKIKFSVIDKEVLLRKLTWWKHTWKKQYICERENNELLISRNILNIINTFHGH